MSHHHRTSRHTTPAGLGDTRFSGVARLYGSTALKRFRGSHLAVVGVGGVGSWAAEALARSGIGTLTLVDLDEVCITNVNRQIHALDTSVGRPKVDVMAERILTINPGCTVVPLRRFFHESSADEILHDGLSGVIDAIDAVHHKCLLLARCRQQGLPVIACGGAGGRRDPAAIRIADLARTSHDALLSQVRRNLRAHHGFPGGGECPLFGIPAVFSTEPPAFPHSDGSACHSRPDDFAPGRRCDAGYGTATHLTAAFGLFAAAELLRLLAAQPGPGRPA